MAVDQLCSRLDGIRSPSSCGGPCGVAVPSQSFARLDERFGSDNRAPHGRRATSDLRAAVGLELRAARIRPTRQAFDRLSVFPRRLHTQAAEGVVSDDELPASDTSIVLTNPGEQVDGSAPIEQDDGARAVPRARDDAFNTRERLESSERSTTTTPSRRVHAEFGVRAAGDWRSPDEQTWATPDGRLSRQPPGPRSAEASAWRDRVWPHGLVGTVGDQAPVSTPWGDAVRSPRAVLTLPGPLGSGSRLGVLSAAAAGALGGAEIRRPVELAGTRRRDRRHSVFVLPRLVWAL